MRSWVLSGLAALLLLACCPVAGALADGGRTPLLMPGKKTLFQRVLTRPGAQILAQPGGAATGTVPPLSIFYVYDRRTSEAGAAFVEVGSNSRGLVKGWIAAGQVIDWKQALVLSFASPANRQRVLFFDSDAALQKLLDANDAKQQLAGIRQQIAQTGHADGDGVVAEEPAQYVDLHKQFYLLPILQAHDTMLASRFPMTMVEVAAVNARPGDAPPLQAERASKALKAFSASLVFVIDATTSMGPYIDAARQVVSEVYQRVVKAGLADKMRFGLVGYRDDPKAVPGIGYLSRIFVDPNKVSNPDDFMRQANQLEPARVSSRAFAEDGFAGLVDAIDHIDWTPFGGRYIVFITDASSRQAGDRFSATGLNADQVREKALAKPIAIYTVHLKTPQGQADHAKAEREYRALSNYPNVGSLYFPVDAGSVTQFRSQIDALAGDIVGQVEAAARGELAAGAPPPEQPAASPAPTPADDLRAKTAALGYAMQLAYIGRTQGVRAPQLLQAWAVDRDIDNPASQSLQERILLTKNQLSDLQAALKEIVRVGISTETSRSKFFDQLKSAMATLSRDPSEVGKKGHTTLKELGLLGEYLDDLPYRSRVMTLSEEMWNGWSIGEQVAFIDDLQARIRLYQSFHDDVDAWVMLDEGGSPGDAVYPVPLSALP